MRFHSSSSLLPWRLLGLVPVLFCLSCSGGKYNSVHGKVLYKNEPLQGVIVTFHPQQKEKPGELSLGVTEEDGSFTLKTGTGEGAPEGEYVVTFYSPEEKSGKTARPKGMTMQREVEDRFKGAYSDVAKSNFKVSIKSGKNELEPFKLK